MAYKKNWMDREGGLFFVFAPFLIGFVLFRFFGQRWQMDLQPFFPLVLLLLVFAGASAYGCLTLSAAFLFFGFFAAEQMNGLSLRALAGGEGLPVLLTLLPWFPGIFAAAQLGLQNSSRLLDAGFSSQGHRLKQSLMTSLLQGLILGGAALASRFLQTL